MGPSCSSRMGERGHKFMKTSMVREKTAHSSHAHKSHVPLKDYVLSFLPISTVNDVGYLIKLRMNFLNRILHV